MRERGRGKGKERAGEGEERRGKERLHSKSLSERDREEGEGEGGREREMMQRTENPLASLKCWMDFCQLHLCLWCSGSLQASVSPPVYEVNDL
jgi:hypothetical protein